MSIATVSEQQVVAYAPVKADLPTRGTSPIGVVFLHRYTSNLRSLA